MDRPETTLVMYGHVEELSLPDLLQAFGASPQCTVVELRAHDRAIHGRIWLQRGRVIAAERGDQRGRAAFFALFAAAPGDLFVVERLHAPPADAEPLGALSMLLLEAIEHALPFARAQTPVPIPATRRAATWDDRGVTTPGVAGGVIAVASVRGGVGRTTVTAQLGRALARHGCRALLIDADNGGDLAAIAGARQPLALPADELLDGEHAIEQAQVEVMPNLNVLAVAAHGAVDWRALLVRARGHADIVIVDCPAGITGGSADLMAACGHLVGVVRSDRGAVAAATALMSFPHLSGVVVNLFDGRSAASVEAFQRIAAVGAPLFETTIPRADAIAAPGAADAEGPIAFLFDALAGELLRACGDQ